MIDHVGISVANYERARAFYEAALAPLGYTVVPVPVTRALHLKTAITALPDGTIIGYPRS